MSSARLVALLVLALGAGCPKPPERTVAQRPPTLPPVPESPHGYAASPITAFADEVTSLAVAAAEGKRLPMVSFPLWSGPRGYGSTTKKGGRRITRDVRYEVEGRRIVEYTRTAVGGIFGKRQRRVVGRVNRGQILGVKAKPPLEVLGFLMSLGAVLTPGERVPGAGPRPGLVIDDVVLYLTRRGLRIASYAVKEGAETPGPLPPTLASLDEVFVPLLMAIRGSELPANAIAAAEIRDLGPWAKNKLVRPDLAARARYQRRLAGFAGASPAGYRLEELSVQVRDAGGRIRYLRLRARTGRTFGLRRLPLVRVAKRPNL